MTTQRPRAFLQATFTEAQFTPFALAIGESTLAWSDLHEHLGRLYGLITLGHNWESALVDWQSNKVDANKRKILRAALANLPAQILTALPKLRESIIWVLDETDKLQEQRNDISHVPLHLVASPSEPVTQENQHHLLANAEVKPHHWANNPRAKRLVGLDIPAEYRYCRDAAVILRNHTLSLGRLEAKLRHHPQPPLPPLPSCR